MVFFANVFCALALMFLSGVVGAFIYMKIIDKIVDEMIDSYDGLVKTQRMIINAQYKMLSNKQKTIQNVYSDLVALRDIGVGHLDEIIGILGETLDDHKDEEEDSECNSDQ